MTSIYICRQADVIIFIYNYDSLVFHFKTYHQLLDCLKMKAVKIILYQKVEVLIIWKLEKEDDVLKLTKHQISYLFRFSPLGVC